MWVALLVGVGAASWSATVAWSRTSGQPIPWTRTAESCTFAGACAASVVALTWPRGRSGRPLVAHRTGRPTPDPADGGGSAAPARPSLRRRPVADPTGAGGRGPRLRSSDPLVAIATVTVLVIGSMTPVMVRAQSSSPVARGRSTWSIVVAGLVLWTPGAREDPRHSPDRSRWSASATWWPRRWSRPSSPSSTSSPATPCIRGSPGPMPPSACDRSTTSRSPGSSRSCRCCSSCSSVGAVVLARAPRSEEELDADEPLVWADVERQFERVDRTRAGAAGTGPDPDGGRPGPRAPSAGSAARRTRDRVDRADGAGRAPGRHAIPTG